MSGHGVAEQPDDCDHGQESNLERPHWSPDDRRGEWTTP